MTNVDGKKNNVSAYIHLRSCQKWTKYKDYNTINNTVSINEVTQYEIKFFHLIDHLELCLTGITGGDCWYAYDVLKMPYLIEKRHTVMTVNFVIRGTYLY